jgi:hypothetical protein
LLGNTKSTIVLPLTLIGMSYDSQKKANRYRHLRALFIRLIELGRTLNQFSPQKKFKIFDRKSADKM